MKISKKLAVMATSVCLVAGAAGADGHVDASIAAAVKARKAVMQLYAYNLGQLGAMAKTTVPYDAEAASKSAGSASRAAPYSHQPRPRHRAAKGEGGDFGFRLQIEGR